VITTDLEAKDDLVRSRKKTVDVLSPRGEAGLIAFRIGDPPVAADVNIRSRLGV
jgi:hypothetical protein